MGTESSPISTAGQVANIGQSVTGILGEIYNIYNSERNYQAQVEQRNWERYNQQEIWGREDTAVTRRVADLRRAGLNPVLAAGSAATTSGPISSKAPEHAPVNTRALGDIVEKFLNLTQMRKNIAMTDQQLKINAEKLRQETAAADVAERDNEILSETNMLSTSPSQVNNDSQLIKNAFPTISPQGNALIQLVMKAFGGAADKAIQLAPRKTILKRR